MRMNKRPTYFCSQIFITSRQGKKKISYIKSKNELHKCEYATNTRLLLFMSAYTSSDVVRPVLWFKEWNPFQISVWVQDHQRRHIVSFCGDMIRYALTATWFSSHSFIGRAKKTPRAQVCGGFGIMKDFITFSPSSMSEHSGSCPKPAW